MLFFAAIVLLGANLRAVFSSLPPLLEDVRAELGLSAAAAGLLTTLPLLCFGLLAPVAPALIRRISIEQLLGACLALTALGAALRGVGGTAGLFAGTLVAGSAVAIAQTTVPTLIRVRFPAPQRQPHRRLLDGAAAGSGRRGSSGGAARAPLRRQLARRPRSVRRAGDRRSRALAAAGRTGADGGSPRAVVRLSQPCPLVVARGVLRPAGDGRSTAASPGCRRSSSTRATRRRRPDRSWRS